MTGPQKRPDAEGPDSDDDAAEKMPVVRFAREELLIPLRGSRAVLTGTPVLAGIICRALFRALRTAVGAGGARPAAEVAPEGDASADPAKEPAGGGTGKPARAGRTGGRAADAGSLGEQLLLGAVVIAVAVGALGTVGAAAAYLLAPYKGWIIGGLIVAWCLTAAAVAPGVGGGDATEDDHENEVGEQNQEHAAERGAEESAGDSWPARRDLLRTFVEHRATAIAGGRDPIVKGKGVPVDHLLAEQQMHGGLIGLDRQSMIDLLHRAGVTVRTQMKFRVWEKEETGEKWREKNLPGVHVDDLRSDLGRTPRLPPHLVTDYTPTSAPVPARESDPSPARQSASIPAPTGGGE